MRTYPNEHGIDRMEFNAPVTAFCPLGNNYYRATVSCEIQLNKKIVDFIDLEDYFKKELNGKSLITEALADEVFNTLTEAYEPLFLRVKVHSDSHFPIDVIKTTY